LERGPKKAILCSMVIAWAPIPVVIGAASVSALAAPVTEADLGRFPYPFKDLRKRPGSSPLLLG
jgi:hypothetical protein